jgi:hypothetical protein
MIITENPLDPKKAKGLVERTFTFRCKQSVNGNIQSIKEVTANPVGLQKELYNELLDFRKLMLCYRLVHYSDKIPQIDTELKNRDKELAGPLLRLFQGTGALAEIEYSLGIFLAQRKEIQVSTFDSAILRPLIANLLIKEDRSELYLEQIWTELKNSVHGRYDPTKPDEYKTKDYGTVYRNTLSQKIVDALGAVRKRKNDGTMLVFDEEKVNQLKETALPKDKVDDTVTSTTTEAEVMKEPEENNEASVSSVSSVRSEGLHDVYGGFVIE